MNRHFKNSIGLIAVTGALAAATSANAIDRYRFVPLRHMGSGGAATSSFVDNFAPPDTNGAVGYVNDSQGNTHACVWEGNPNGPGDYSLKLLPDIGGFNSVAHSADATVVIDTAAQIVVAGEAQDTAGVTKPVVWTQEPDGSFTPHVLTTLGGSYGSAANVMHYPQCNGTSCGDLAIVGTTQTAAGDFHATYWQQTPGGFRAIDLGTLGGQGSEAFAIDWSQCDPTNECSLHAVGRAQTASGAWHACEWIVHDDGYPTDPAFIAVDRNPGNAAGSWFMDTCGHGDHFAACGAALTANGHSVAFFDDKYWLPTLLTVPNANNTAADAIACTRYGNLIAGRAWNDPANTRAVIWNNLADIGTRVYPLEWIVEGAPPSAVISVAAIDSNRIFAGSYNEGGFSGITAPMLLIPDGTQLPDTVAVTLGDPEPNFRETDLWHAGDGNTLRIRTRNQDGDAASVEARVFGAAPLSGSYPNSIACRVTARITSSPGAMAQMDVQVYNFGSGMWDGVGVHAMSDVFGTMVERFATAGHENPNTGEVRIRLNFTPLTGKIKGVEIDQLTIGG